jgi:hypothetical protein
LFVRVAAHQACIVSVTTCTIWLPSGVVHMIRPATLDLGIALHADAIVAEDLAAGRLRRVLPK